MVATITGGLDAGRSFPLAAGTHVIGRDRASAVRASSPTVSRAHARVDVSPQGVVAVTDLDSTNGVRRGDTFVAAGTDVSTGEPITLGAAQVAFQVLVPSGLPPAPGPTPTPPPPSVPFNRPPRMAEPPPPSPLVMPEMPRRHGTRHPFSWAMVLTPVVVGLALAILLNPMFAVFTLLSPIATVTAWLEQRRRARRADTADARQARHAVASFERRVRAARDDDARRHRIAAPDLGLLLARAEGRDPRLWERRPWHADFLHVRVGTAAQPWRPALEPALGPPVGAVAEVLARVATLPDDPVVVDLGPGRAVGLAGPTTATRAVARSLVAQLSIQSGPADLAIEVAGLDLADLPPPWVHLAGLPHLPTSDDVAAEPAVGDDRTRRRTPVRVTILDRDLRRAGGGRHAGTGADVAIAPGDRRSIIVLAGRVADLPSWCTTVVDCLGALGRATVSTPQDGTRVHDVLLQGASLDTAARAARALAGLVDPDADTTSSALPAAVSLADVLGFAVDDVEAIGARWREPRGTHLRVALGLGRDGPAVVDLIADGPHALIGGTTGSGKSELLRALIAGLAATRSPDEVTFVLIDYKGGSAFDLCGALPHTVGLVTDLDDELGERALISLEAELRRRERCLRERRASDVLDLRTHPEDERPLPRLVVVIDEFATLATELPRFLDALVSIAQRGRSLGVHLVLATQRPHGAISDNIRTNTNIRVALRMLDDADAVDVIGTAAAAALPRSVPGRAIARLGRDELVPFHACYPSAVVAEPSSPDRAPTTELAVLVAAIADAHRARGGAAPRRPWLPPLPEVLPVDDLPVAAAPAPSAAGADRAARARRALEPVTVGLLDDPSAQRQVPWVWDPTRGSLLVYGMPGSGATSTLVTVATQLARRHTVDELHLYAIGHLDSPLGAVPQLPHTGDLLRADQPARHARLLTMLTDELRRRRDASQRRAAHATPTAGTAPDDPGEPAIVLLVDDLSAVRAAHDDLHGIHFLEAFSRLALDGPPSGIHVALAADRPQAMPAAITAASDQRLVLHLPDPYDYGLCGARIVPPRRTVPGRARTTSGLEVQVAHTSAEALVRVASSAAGAARERPPRRRPATVAELPAHVDVDELPPVVLDEPWSVWIGVGDHDLRPRGLDWYAGDHVLVTGPPRSGRSTFLHHIATRVAEAGAAVVVLRAPTAARGAGRATTATSAVERDAPHRLPLLVEHPAALGDALAALGEQPFLLCIDDADAVDDAQGAITAALALPHARVLASARADRLRRAYGHWTRPLRDARLGLALQPDLDADGDLWSVRFTSMRGRVWPAGRAILVRDRQIEVIQVAGPCPPS